MKDSAYLNELVVAKSFPKNNGEILQRLVDNTRRVLVEQHTIAIK